MGRARRNLNAFPARATVRTSKFAAPCGRLTLNRLRLSERVDVIPTLLATSKRSVVHLHCRALVTGDSYVEWSHKCISACVGADSSSESIARRIDISYNRGQILTLTVTA